MLYKILSVLCLIGMGCSGVVIILSVLSIMLVSMWVFVVIFAISIAGLMATTNKIAEQAKKAKSAAE